MSPLLSVSDVGKSYRHYRSHRARLMEWFLPMVGTQHEAKWVVRHVNFEVSPGEAVAVMGMNGAGKSTLLKMIVGTTRPSEGSVQRNGRVSALLELGLGFHPSLTGRQNVFTAAQLMGIASADIARLLPKIENFAEIGEAIDEPVRSYSSGMQMRLAFSVATAVRPDLLIVDEALAVGDTYFQHKSFARIREFRESGTSLLFVSHDAGAVKSLCDRAILLNKGKVAMDAQPDQVVDYYNAIIAEKETRTDAIQQSRRNDGWMQTRSGSGEARVEKIRLVDARSEDVIHFAHVGQRVKLVVDVSVQQLVERLVLGLMIRDRTGHIVWGTNTHHTQQSLSEMKAGESLTYEIEFEMRIGPGSYSVSPALVSSETHLESNFEWIDNYFIFEVVNPSKKYFIGSNWLDTTWSVKRAASI